MNEYFCYSCGLHFDKNEAFWMLHDCVLCPRCIPEDNSPMLLEALGFQKIKPPEKDKKTESLFYRYKK